MAAATGPQISDAARALDAGRAAEVRPYLEQSVNAKPGDAFAWALLARTYLALKEPAKAKVAAGRAERGVAAGADAGASVRRLIEVLFGSGSEQNLRRSPRQGREECLCGSCEAAAGNSIRTSAGSPGAEVVKLPWACSTSRRAIVRPIPDVPGRGSER